MRLLTSFITSIILFLLPINSAAETTRVYILDINEEIDGTAWRHTRMAIDEINKATTPYDLMIVHINTYGGAVDMADSIRTALLRLETPTVGFIDRNAASAGALIALACDTLFMSPGASIGAATVVDNDGNPMPVKYQSYWSSVFRATAMIHGKYIPEGDSIPRWRRDPEIAAAMVDPNQAISFTATEAIEAGVVDAIAMTTADAAAKLGHTNAEFTKYESSLTDYILGFLASAGVRAILIMLIIGGIYMEMHTAGMGFAAAVSTVAAVLYFLPMIITGTLAPWVILLFIAGIVLLALEIFVIPGFGIAGVLGLFSTGASLVGAMLDNAPGGGADFSGLGQAVMILISGCLLATIAVWYLTSKHGPKRFQRIAALQTELRSSDGYVGVDASLESLVGHNAITITDLRPSGKVEYAGTRYDATSTGTFIPRGTEVIIIRYEAAQLYVEPVENNK